MGQVAYEAEKINNGILLLSQVVANSGEKYSKTCTRTTQTSVAYFVLQFPPAKVMLYKKERCHPSPVLAITSIRIDQFRGFIKDFFGIILN